MLGVCSDTYIESIRKPFARRGDILRLRDEETEWTALHRLGRTSQQLDEEVFG
jgi:hypothetical protein